MGPLRRSHPAGASLLIVAATFVATSAAAGMVRPLLGYFHIRRALADEPGRRADIDGILAAIG